MNHKINLIIGATGIIAHTLLLLPVLEDKKIQGIILVVFSLLIFTSILFIGLKTATHIRAIHDSCESLCCVLFNMLAYTFLFNAFCMIISHDSLWTISIIQSILFPIILAGFVGNLGHLKHYRYCSTAALVITVVSNSFYPEIAILNQLAILSYALCMLIPAGTQCTKTLLANKNI